MQRPLNREELLTVSDVLKSHTAYLLKAFDELSSGNASGDKIQAISNAVTSEMLRLGFDENDEPNDLGIKLENIVSNLDFRDR